MAAAAAAVHTRVTDVVVDAARVAAKREAVEW